ncbi:hypothetical protein LSM04_000970 [Trypanosoma melophagium]|uniref:uncharacterized protein n=1 Tax=Trypanosoma melophagium TaxID=715481 RepID=UPI00351A62AA|nr:hypothetical protein LSM04_000970 [Trypanosoma melophagium]
MSLLKADQVRRELFITYSRQIAELLDDTEEKPLYEDPTPRIKEEEKENVRFLGQLESERTREKEEETQEQPEEVKEEEEREEESPNASKLSKRFRISYARQHLLRQRALRLPDLNNDYKADSSHLVSSPVAAGKEKDEEEEENDYDYVKTIGTTTSRTEKKEKEKEEECRLAYNEPYPSLHRMMRRVQDEALRVLVREAREAPAVCRNDDYTKLRLTVLRQLEEAIGQDRITLLARLQKMDGKLHLLE